MRPRFFCWMFEWHKWSEWGLLYYKELPLEWRRVERRSCDYCKRKQTRYI